MGRDAHHFIRLLRNLLLSSSFTTQSLRTTISWSEVSRVGSPFTSRWISIWIDVPGSSRTSAPRESIPIAAPATPPIPAPIPAPLPPPVTAPITAPVVAPSAAVLTFVGASLSWRIVPSESFTAECSAPGVFSIEPPQHYGIAVRIDHRGKVDQHFGSPFHVSATLCMLDLALDVGSGWDHDAVVDHKGEDSLGIHRISVFG